MGIYRLEEILARWPPGGAVPLAAPVYRQPPMGTAPDRLMLGVASMRRHMTDEGHQLQEGLAAAGYQLWGRGYPGRDETDVGRILGQTRPGTVVVQDRREWDPAKPGCFDPAAEFLRPERLRLRSDLFRLTVLKDAHADQDYHQAAARVLGVHAWVIYYHPAVVAAQAPYVRPAHLVRTYHSLNPRQIPPFAPWNRRGCVLSGALGPRHYPLRTRLAARAAELPQTTVLRHPGYGCRGSATERYLGQLSGFRAAICTASAHGYALRKIIEAVACGCRVITDLPPEEVLPGGIDEHLIRVHPQDRLEEIAGRVREALADWNPERQQEYARRAQTWYDYLAVGQRLTENIEKLRQSYPQEAL